MPKHDLLCAFICGSGVVPRRFGGSRIVQGVPGGSGLFRGEGSGGTGGFWEVPRGFQVLQTPNSSRLFV